jgi:2'-5' RNA ligase
MHRLFTVSYPVVSPESSALISRFRERHDARQHQVVDAHFTLVFGCDAVPLPEYTAHVAEVAAASRAITFSCRYAMLGADDESETAYVYLVPDEGYAEVSLLHDRLYTGPLRTHLRLGLPYIPHITIGTLDNRGHAKALCDELNQRSVCIEGCLQSLSVGTVEGSRFHNLSVHALGGA